MSRSRKVVDAKQDNQGNISHVKLNGNKNWTPVDKAIDMAEQGKLGSVDIWTRFGMLGA